MVVDRPKNLLLQSRKSMFPLSVQWRHVDAKETEQAVGDVFSSCAVSGRFPRHFLGNAEVIQRRTRPAGAQLTHNGLGNPGNLGKKSAEACAKVCSFLPVMRTLRELESTPDLRQIILISIRVPISSHNFHSRIMSYRQPASNSKNPTRRYTSSSPPLPSATNMSTNPYADCES